MRARRVFGTLVALGLVVGCQAAATTPTPTSAPPSPVEVTLTDAMRIEPAQMSVPAGVPVTFVVTNTGVIDHEFFVGDEEEQAHHEEEMMDSTGQMGHDEPGGVSVAPGATEELVYTFPASGETLAGCHIPGHYPAGMKATISVLP